MRVISGTARGHKLITPTNLKTRPTGDRMKEDLFNILAPSIRDAAFLDMYCGSGAIGIEALSRGAKETVFIDASKEAIAATEANLFKTRLKDRAEIIYMEVSQALKKLQGRMFNIIFMDPPYDISSGELNLVFPLIVHGGFLAEKGIIVAECPADAILPDFAVTTGLSVDRQKIYAQTQFIFYSREGRDDR